jgi:hypothetical protein
MFPAKQPVQHISHYRLNTGYTTVSRRDAVDDRSIGGLEPLLSPGRHKLPNTEGYTVEMSLAVSFRQACVKSAATPT